MQLTLSDWFNGGERLFVRLQRRLADQESKSRTLEFKIFSRVDGEGQIITCLHGFPTCSWDFARIIPPLVDRYRTLAFDFLGFGDSDKPGGHRYSLLEQADLTEAVWKHYHIDRTCLVAHDYGSTVAVELLSRQLNGELATRLTGIVLMNAGLYIDLQRPLLAQRLLQVPLAGALLSRVINQSFFDRQFASLFSPSHPVSEDDLRQYWSAIKRHDGLHIYHRLIYYLTERRLNKERWEKALEQADIPVRYVWGLIDPVSGAQISGEIRRRIPSVDLVELPDVGHYPHLEVPAIVAAEIEAFTSNLTVSARVTAHPAASARIDEPRPPAAAPGGEFS